MKRNPLIVAVVDQAVRYPDDFLKDETNTDFRFRARDIISNEVYTFMPDNP
jgi:hypothetical protein